MSKLLLFCGAFFLISCATQSSKEKEELSNLHLRLAVENIKSEDYPSALKELLIAEDYYPKNPYVHANLGLVYFVREKYELSEKHYLYSLSLKSDFTEAKNNLARIYIELGKYDKAKKLLDEALEDLTYPNFAKTYTNYGILQFQLKNYEDAIKHLKKSLETDRENCFSQVYLGRSYLELKDLSSAILNLDKAIFFCERISSDEAHYYSAIALFRNGQKSRAKFRFEEILRIFPNGKNSDKAKKMLDLINKGGV